MKPLIELRNKLDFHPQEISSSVSYFFKNKIDWEVYLPTRGFNLQREFVWNLDQKRELIYSMLIGRHIPHCAIINIINPNNENEDIFQVIDGRQRLTTINLLANFNPVVLGLSFNVTKKYPCFDIVPVNTRLGKNAYLK